MKIPFLKDKFCQFSPSLLLPLPSPVLFSFDHRSSPWKERNVVWQVSTLERLCIRINWEVLRNISSTAPLSRFLFNWSGWGKNVGGEHALSWPAYRSLLELLSSGIVWGRWLNPGGHLPEFPVFKKEDRHRCLSSLKFSNEYTATNIFIYSSVGSVTWFVIL